MEAIKDRAEAILNAKPLNLHITDKGRLPDEQQELLSHPLVQESLKLIGQFLVLSTQSGPVLATIAEIEAYEIVGRNFRKSFCSRERHSGQWFVASIRGGKVFTIVIDPQAMSVLRIKTIQDKGRKRTFSSWMNEHCPDIALDGQVLPSDVEPGDTSSPLVLRRGSNEVVAQVTQGTHSMIALVCTIR